MTILKLPEDVINRIAAGEVVQSPSAALKELLENSLDAGATQITIQYRDGGLQMLKVIDNGCGIPKDDFPLVAERFATSKLRCVEDLTSLDTFGFRGEAIASLSYVAHVTMITRHAGVLKTDTQMGTERVPITVACPMAYTCTYRDGKLLECRETPTAMAHRTAEEKVRSGTIFIIENLFYNYPTRRGAFSRTIEEITKMIELVQRYALQNPGKGFTLGSGDCSRHVDLHVPASLKTSALVLRHIYGGTLADEILAISGRDNEKEISAQRSTQSENIENGVNEIDENLEPDQIMHFTGLVSGPFYTTRRATFIFFINGRWVQVPCLRRCCEQAYMRTLPRKCRPFVYLCLRIRPDYLDVNVHPTKQKVQFLFEDTVLQVIYDTIVETVIASTEKRKDINPLNCQISGEAALPRQIDLRSANDSRNDEAKECEVAEQVCNDPDTSRVYIKPETVAKEPQYLHPKERENLYSERRQSADVVTTAKSVLAPHHVDRSIAQRGEIEKYLQKTNDKSKNGDITESQATKLVDTVKASESESDTMNPHELEVPHDWDDEEPEAGKVPLAFQNRSFKYDAHVQSLTSKSDAPTSTKNTENNLVIKEEHKGKRTERVVLPRSIQSNPSSILTSVRDAIQKFEDDKSPVLNEILRNSSFVGSLSPAFVHSLEQNSRQSGTHDVGFENLASLHLTACYAFLQYKTSLYLLDVSALSESVAFQHVFIYWSRWPRINLELDVPEILRKGAKTVSSCKEQAIAESCETFSCHLKMLASYFGIVFSENGAQLIGLPLLLGCKSYRPDTGAFQLFFRI